jgi:adenine-specific DNA-methyltransferase
MAKKDYTNLTKDQLLEVIEKLEGKKKYGLVWDEERVPEKVVTDCQDKLPVLTEVKGKEITTDENEPTHILIEGDNYHALSVLNYTHKGKIDLIYIDPPYNTGNKDFIYNDKYVEKEDTWRHSKWLAFMNKRLDLAKDLLAEKGVIFISIDDNEQSQLKLLCDSVFGEENFIGNICWFKKRKGSFLSNNLVSLTEYILAYKKGSGVKLFGGETDNSESQPIVKRTNSIKTLKFPANFVKTKLKDGIYKAGNYGTGTTSTVLRNDIEVENKIIKNDFEIEAPFTWTQSFLESEIENGTEVLINTNNLQPRVIRTNNSSFKAMPSFIDGREIGATNEDAYEMLKSIFKVERPFSYSKPVNLIKKLINSVSYFKDEMTVLDFFAGSGTTAHAVLDINSTENKNIKYILCTSNENNNGDGKIADDVCYPRLKSVMKGYENLKGEEIEGLGNNLKYFKTSFVANNRNKDQLKIDITKRCTEMLCLKEGIFNLLKEEADYKIFQQGKRYLAVYYDFANVSLDELKEEMNALKGEKVLYCFTVDNHGLDKANFRGWKNIRLEPIPQKILDVYKRIFKN